VVSHAEYLLARPHAKPLWGSLELFAMKSFVHDSELGWQQVIHAPVFLSSSGASTMATAISKLPDVNDADLVALAAGVKFASLIEGPSGKAHEVVSVGK
jgi:hypothetical protein